MNKLFSRLKMAIGGTRLWLKAIDLAAERNYPKAKECLLEMKAIGVEPNIEYCLLYGFLEYVTEENDKALAHLNEGIQKITNAKKLSGDEKKYLEAYASGLVKEIEQTDKFIDFEAVNLSKIPSHLKNKFPLIKHPRWEDS